jgi:hypothetical protein
VARPAAHATSSESCQSFRCGGERAGRSAGASLGRSIAQDVDPDNTTLSTLKPGENQIEK